MRVMAILAMMIATTVLGCDQKQEPLVNPAPASPATQPAPATAPVVELTPNASALAPVDTQPAGSFISVDGRVYTFPRALLRLRPNGNGLSAVLYTDDPRDALEPNYTGNSYYLQMPLSVDDPQDIARARWVYRAASSERIETTDGIFLDGHKTQLQPLDVVARFDGRPPLVRVTLSGKFLAYSTVHQDVPVAPTIVQVQADEIQATVPAK